MWREGLGESVKLDLRKASKDGHIGRFTQRRAASYTPIESDGLAACPAAEAPIERSGF